MWKKIELKKSGRPPKVPKALIIDEPIKSKSSKKKESVKENKNYIELKTFCVHSEIFCVY